MRPPPNPRLLVLAVLALSFLVAACASDREAARNSRMYAEVRAPLDRELTERIERTLAWDGILRRDSDDVHVRTVDGVVTLDGTVRREETVERLDEVIPRISGVVGVLNLVAVGRSHGAW